MIDSRAARDYSQRSHSTGEIRKFELARILNSSDSQVLKPVKDKSREDNNILGESLTPKVLANSSPGLSFGNPGNRLIHWERTLKELCLKPSRILRVDKSSQ